jgi:hypothetical protein
METKTILICYSIILAACVLGMLVTRSEVFLIVIAWLLVGIIIHGAIALFSILFKMLKNKIG